MRFIELDFIEKRLKTCHCLVLFNRGTDSESINNLEKNAAQKGRFAFLSEWLRGAVVHKRPFDAKALQYKSSCILVAEDNASVRIHFLQFVSETFYHSKDGIILCTSVVCRIQGSFVGVIMCGIKDVFLEGAVVKVKALTATPSKDSKLTNGYRMAPGRICF